MKRRDFVKKVVGTVAAAPVVVSLAKADDPAPPPSVQPATPAPFRFSLQQYGEMACDVMREHLEKMGALRLVNFAPGPHIYGDVIDSPFGKVPCNKFKYVAFGEELPAISEVLLRERLMELSVIPLVETMTGEFLFAHKTLDVFRNWGVEDKKLPSLQQMKKQVEENPLRMVTMTELPVVPDGEWAVVTQCPFSVRVHRQYRQDFGYHEVTIDALWAEEPGTVYYADLGGSIT